MNRAARRATAVLACAGIAGLWGSVPGTQAATFNQVYREGVEYVDIDPPVPTDTGDGVEVVEMFWYGCETCYAIQPYMHNWIRTQPKTVHYKRLPAALNPAMELDARTFFAAQVLGLQEKIQEPLFSAIHEEHRNLDSERAMAAFFREFGVSDDDFMRAFNSPAVAGKMFHIRNLTARYGIHGVPAIVVDGRYYTDPTHVKSPEELVMVVNFLVKMELRRLNK
jgi:thiol:disulfide interchange protein DsbA